MNDPQKYKELVAKHFQNVKWKGVGTATNNITGSIGQEDYSQFQRAFERRLERLSSRYPHGPERSQIEIALREVASKNNWEGAYAELVAYDFLGSAENWRGISLNQTVPASQTLAGELGNQNANFDGYYEHFNTYFDIKTLSDKSKDILAGAISEAIGKTGIAGLSIIPEYPLDMDFVRLEKKRSEILKEIIAAIKSRRVPTIPSSVVEGLSYKFLEGPGILTSVSTYDPYAHAQNHHTLLFKHAKKFSKSKPSLIVFVVFPWFSEPVPDLAGARETFFRSFCRRFFCQYSKDPRTAQQFHNALPKDTLAYTITQHLSGVLFIDDRSITAEEPFKQNIRASAFLNPNAKHSVGRTFRAYLSELGFNIDGFENDNY